MPRRSNGDGSVWQRPDGRWVAAIPAGASPTGKRIFRYYRTEREARAGLRALLREAETGRIAQPGHLTLRDLAAEFVDAATTAGRSPNTLKQYEQHLRLRILPTLGHHRLRELRPAHTQRLLAQLLRRGRRRRLLGPDAPEGLAQNTVAGVFRVLRTLARFAVRRGYLALPFTEGVVGPRPADTEKAVMDEGAMRRLIETSAAADDPQMYLWAFLADTGARIGEAAGLQWPDLFLTPPADAPPGWRPSVRILRRLEAIRAVPQPDGPPLLLPVFAETKHRSNRTIPMGFRTASLLLELKRRYVQYGHLHPANLVFLNNHGAPLSRGFVHYRLKVALRRAGLPVVSVHGLRHANATALLQRKVPTEVVSRRLGHANESVTLRAYSHVTQTAADLAAAEVDRMLGTDDPEPDDPDAGPGPFGVQDSGHRAG